MIRRWLTTWRVLFLVLPIILCACLILWLSIDLIRFRRLPVHSTPDQLMVDGRVRTYRLYVVPSNVTGAEPVPVLFVLHGGGGDAESAERLTRSGFHDLADEHGFLVVYPEGVDNHWNDGRSLDDTASQENIDDIGFFAALINHLDEKYTIDRARVYATGISNGGFMSYRLACDLSDQIAGIAAVTANLSDELAANCHPTRPVSILIINGTDDPLVLFGGGDVKILRQVRGTVLSTTDTVAFWREQNGCTQSPVIERLPDRDPDDHTRVRYEASSGCASGHAVDVYVVEGGGHTWPGGAQYLHRWFIGRTSRDIDANTIIWSFFEAQASLATHDE